VAGAGGNLVVLQGGGPTAVLNTSLFGVLDEARRSGKINRILGAPWGVKGLAQDAFIDLSNLLERELNHLKTTPGAALGSTRFKPESSDLERITDRLRKNDVRYLVLIGGNGSLRGAQTISKAAQSAGYELCVIGVPKTIDNDIAGTDRCPGFGSAARYVAQSVRDLGMDVRTLPQPVSIFETMGRSVGWLAGASILSRFDERHAPHLIYLPEKPFDVAKFVGDVDRVVRKLGWAVAVVTEGMKDAKGQPIFETPHRAQRDALDRGLPGGVAAFLAETIARELNIRCRWEKPGLCGRSSMLHVSAQDRLDAEAVGRAAVRAALDGAHGMMVSLRPLNGRPRPPECDLVPLAQVAGNDRVVPDEWMDRSDTAVAPSFIDYVRPIVGDLLEYATPLAELVR
jgi:6-phosphofructokinase